MWDVKVNSARKAYAQQGVSINKVSVTTRDDAADYAKLESAKVFIDDALCGTLPAAGSLARKTEYSVACSLSGSRVRIQSGRGDGGLEFAEVTVESNDAKIAKEFGSGDCLSDDSLCQGNLVCEATTFPGVDTSAATSYSNEKICVKPAATWGSMNACPTGTFADWFNG